MMQLKTIHRILLYMLPGILAAMATTGASQPNIVIIYADDVGYGDLGCYGASAVSTPNLDALAASGLRFTSAYATASTCTPSRYSLLTGEYAFRNTGAKILPGNAPLIIDTGRHTLPSLLRDHGYRTGLVGKWHLGLGDPDHPLDWNGEIKPGPREVGFTYSFHMAATGDRVPTVYIENGYIVDLDPDDPVSVSYEGPIDDNPTGVSHPELLRVQADLQHAGTIVDGTSRIGFMTGGKVARWTDATMPDTFLSKAVDFIRENTSQPFFLYYATHENHVPRLPHPRFAGASGLGPRGDAIVQMDWSIGRLMEVLEEENLLEDTLVIFASDNGPVLYDGYLDGAVEQNGDHRPAGPWKGGKYSVREGGTRLPFIVSWKGTIQPALSDALFSQVDLLASLASIAGVDTNAFEKGDSQNHSAVLMGQDKAGRDHLLQQGVASHAIRSGDWKYIPPGTITNRTGISTPRREPVPEPGLLFYLPEDPEESRNLAEAYPGIRQELASQLKHLLDETDR